MIDKETAYTIYSTLIESSYFNSEIDCKFLKYLIDASVSHRSLKEIDIAMEFFGRTEDFDSTADSIVRSHMYSLRKKLQTFYLTEGKEDKMKLVLPKGQYKVQLISSQNQAQKKKIKKNQYIILGLIFLIPLSLFIYYFQKSYSLQKQLSEHQMDQHENPIWSEFIDSSLPTLLVIGDYYVLQQPLETNERERFIRDVEINSKEDFEKYLKNNPQENGKITETPLTYLGMEVPYVVSNMDHIFNGHKELLNIKLASDLAWQDMLQNNIIFVGSVKTLRQMNIFFNQLRFKVNLFPHKVFYTPFYRDTTETYSLESYYRYGFHDDYTVVAKFPTENNVTLLIISFSSFGKVEALKKLSDPEYFKEILKKNQIKGDLPPYFEMLLRVSGVERSGLNTEILHFHEIDSNLMNINHDFRDSRNN